MDGSECNCSGRWFLKYLLCSVLTVVFVLALFWVYVLHAVDFKFLSSASCRHMEPLGGYDGFTYCFYGSEWNEGAYLSSITSFYSTLITVLVAVQSLISGLAFVVIRASNKRGIEDEVEKEVPKYFSTVGADEKIRALVHDAVVKTMRAEENKNEDAIKDLRGELEDLQEKVLRFAGDEEISFEDESGEGDEK